MYHRPGFVDELQHRFNRTKENNQNNEDIYDGAVYKELYGDFRSNKNSISLMSFTDGVSHFKSKNLSLSSYFFTINELPYIEHIQMENTILAGLWFGPTKPSPNLFTQAFSDDLKELYN